MAKFYHRTNNLDPLASSGRIKALKHLARENPDLEIEVEPTAGGLNIGGLRSKREKMRVEDAYNRMRDIKDVDNVFLTKDVLPPKAYGKYVIEKDLSAPKFNTSMNLIANEHITGRALSIYNNATVYAPDMELDDLRQDYEGINFKGFSEMDARNPRLVDRAKTLYGKITKEASISAGLLGLGVGAYMNKDRLLGYHEVYHGTSKDAAQNIKKTGLDPNYGGSGAASTSGRDEFVEHSRNKVHYTKLKNVAKGYANTVDDGGEVLRAYIPHSQWESSEVDPDARWGINTSKNVAATTTDPITVENLKAKARDYLDKSNLSEYYGTESGRDRAAIGAISAVGMGTGAALAARYMSKIK